MLISSEPEIGWLCPTNASVDGVLHRGRRFWRSETDLTVRGELIYDAQVLREAMRAGCG